MNENERLCAMFADGLIERHEVPPECRHKPRGPKPLPITVVIKQVAAASMFASDDVLGATLLGADRVQEWKQMAPLLEARGLPQIDTLMGGRYMRAVVAFFDHQYGLDRGGDVPLAPDGIEDFEGWKQKSKRQG